MATTRQGKGKHKPQKTAPAETQININFNAPVDMPSVYATNVIIQPMEFEVLVSFYEIQPPLLMGPEAENLAILQESGMRADCVAKVIISKQRFEVFADLMKQMATTFKTG